MDQLKGSVVKKIVAVGVMVLLGILAYSISTKFAARNSAVRIAASRPFCIQIATQNGYRELSSITQLAGLRMKGRFALNHAVLIIGDLHQPQLLNWSYRANAFVAGAYGPPPLYCRPRHDYFRSLEQSAERDDTMLFIAFGEAAERLIVRRRGRRVRECHAVLAQDRSVATKPNSKWLR
jgi:hypothetical protein